MINNNFNNHNFIYKPDYSIIKLPEYFNTPDNEITELVKQRSPHDIFNETPSLPTHPDSIHYEDYDLSLLEAGLYASPLVSTKGMDRIDKQPINLNFAEKLSPLVNELKLQISSLKVIAGILKVCHLKEERKIVKQIKSSIEYILGLKAINNGTLDYNLSQLLQNSKKRKSIISSYFITTGLISSTLSLIDYLNQPAIRTLMGSSLVNQSIQLLTSNLNPLKLIYKLSCLETAFVDWKNFEGQSKDLSTKRITLLKTSMEVGSEVTKVAASIGLLSHPLIPTALAVSSMMTGSLSFYLNYPIKPTKIIEWTDEELYFMA